MKGIILITSVLTGLLALTANATASSETRLLDDGTPIRVHFANPALDSNHDESRLQRSYLNDAKYRQDTSKPSASTVGFQPPLRRGLSNNIPAIMHIAAFVDHEEARPGGLLDWNCGERTYDTQTFNHNGTDYNAAQFPWLTMANDGLVVVAAADGEIVDKHDGEPDQNCSSDPSKDANLVVLRHANGKITIYAHMKKGTVTPRKIGDMVEQGDYLGVMGSSGLSSGPHLHLGVQDMSDNLYDPYAGACNALNNESLWQNQEPYIVKEILALATHSANPEYPPCPQQEKPHFQDVFAADDMVFASVTVRDLETGDEIGLQVIGPSGQDIVSTSYSHSDPAHVSGSSLTLSFSPGSNPMPGKYTWRASYAGEVMEHNFYIGAGPAPEPGAVAANNAFTGLWYDPLLDGEGFNIVTSGAGTIVYFYGSDDRGNRVWLISDLIPGVIMAGQTIKVLMYESSGGIFLTPVASSRGLAIWGTLSLRFNTCENGQSTLTGTDGTKVSFIKKLAGVSGAACVQGSAQPDSPWAGLWYDPAKDGEGYNLIVSPVGRILYFYGFRSSGLRLWLISELITQTLEVGMPLEVTLYEATQGTFAGPVPSDEALVVWGTAKITVVSCTEVIIVIDGTDGKKTSNTVRLAGIIGASCAL